MPEQAPRTAVIVHAHPESASFATAQMRAAESALILEGYKVEVLDLYELQWNPVLDRQEFGSGDGYFKPQAQQMAAAADGTLPMDVATHLGALLDADLLVLSFPMWWFSMPAILKGWIDRVFVMGSVFGGEWGFFDQGALTSHRAILLVTTGGSEQSFTPGGQFGDLRIMLHHIHYGMLAFVGYDVLDPVVTYGPAHLDDDDRRRALDDVQNAFRSIDTRGVLRLELTSDSADIPA